MQAAIPAERLLIFNVKQGWGPLCAYLGRPVPAGIPFPHVHTRAKLQGEMYFLELVTWIWPLALLLPLAVLHLLAAGGRRGGAAPSRRQGKEDAAAGAGAGAGAEGGVGGGGSRRRGARR